MVQMTRLDAAVNPVEFLRKAATASTVASIEELLGSLPITLEDEYAFREEHPEAGWQEGKFHWMPVGRDRGNAGRIKLANLPVNPIAERLINGRRP